METMVGSSATVLFRGFTSVKEMEGQARMVGSVTVMERGGATRVCSGGQ